MPECRDANGNLQLGCTALLQFSQGQIRLGLDPASQPAIVRGQTGTAITADFFGQALASPAMLVPKAFHTFATDAKVLADFASAFTTFSGCNDTLSQILA
jgi:hypothetical protein